MTTKLCCHDEREETPLVDQRSIGRDEEESFTDDPHLTMCPLTTTLRASTPFGSERNRDPGGGSCSARWPTSRPQLGSVFGGSAFSEEEDKVIPLLLSCHTTPCFCYRRAGILIL